MNTEPSSRLVDIDWRPSPRKCRQFAVCLAVLVLLSAWYFGTARYGWWALGCATCLVFVSWLWPTSIRPLYRTVMLVTLPIGMVLGEASLWLIYVAVFVPMGFLFRLARRDSLQRKLDRHALSYWEESPTEPPKNSYLRRY